MAANSLKESQTLRGIFYPRKITYVLSSLKIAAGCGLVLLGALALYQKASYARTASGLWSGIIVIISGVLGAFSVKMSASRAYVWAFFASCSMSIISTVLVIIYSATGLARDSGFPGGFVRDIDTGELVPVTEDNFPPREGAMFINLGLILLGVLDILFTLPCCIICLRELCDCYNGMSGGSSLGLLDGHTHPGAGPTGYPDDQSEWLMSWMGQPPFHHHHNNIYFSQASGMPLPHHSPYKLPAPPPYPTLMAAPHQNTPPFVMIHPSDPSHSSGHSPGIRSSRRSRSQSGHGHAHAHAADTSSGSEKRNRSKSPRHSSAEGGRRPRQQQILVPAGHFAPMELYYPYVPPPVASYPSPGSQYPGSQWGYPYPHPGGYPAHPGHPGYEYEAYYNPQYYDYQQHYMAMYGHAGHRGRRSTSSRASKRPRSKSGGRSDAEKMMADPRSHNRPKKKSKKGPTDSDIEKTYTGLDRELAEEFIEQTMDPGIIVERTLQSGTESEAW